MQKQHIINEIKTAFPSAKIELKSDDDVHFFLTIATQEFKGRSKIEQHRMVYAALGEKVGRDIHALSINTVQLED